MSRQNIAGEERRVGGKQTLTSPIDVLGHTEHVPVSRLNPGNTSWVNEEVGK